MKEFESNGDSCISGCIPTCEKDIYPNARMVSKMGADVMDKGYDLPTSFEMAGAAREIGLENILNHRPESELISRKFQFTNFRPVDYLSLVKPHMSDDLISSQNYDEIRSLAEHFTGGLTSFFGFESHLGKSDARSDYLFAVSSKKGEREVLANLIENDKLPETFRNQLEWQRVGNFAKAWADPKSVLYNNVLGLWFEFDTSGSLSEVPVPNIFLQTKKIRIDVPEDIEKITWITETALPLLTGQHTSKKIEERLLNSIQQLPEGTALIHIGTMLSRGTYGVRIVINRIQPKQIIPYLKSLGWSNETGELPSLIDELEKYASRMILHINIGEDNIDPKIGLECSFSRDLYHQETGWTNFLDYLTKKKLCLPDKKSALLNFLGTEQENTNQDFDPESYIPSVMIPDNNFSSSLVRYISHVKIVYKPNHPLNVKAYSGVRLFGCPDKPADK